ncbi:MAG TPA: ADP-ribosylglycohydrolase family protein [Burkholderiaceae bacterium]|jgi:ADP-ribosylglycohydrolase|nr:ADP-ribosylglycohydrolase family protein [Burkholderiaceae bacterium]
MLGAIAGDVIGSVHEHAGTKTKYFPLLAPHCRFTDDSVLTVAVADALLGPRDYVDAFHDWFWRYPHAGYGGTFAHWALSRRREPYNSWGNGAAMRVSPIAWAFDSLDEVLAQARRSAEVTHDHPEGIRGAQATAAAVFLARQRRSKQEIRDEIECRFNYRLDAPLDAIRPSYRFDVSCQGSVPQSIIAFLESSDYEDAVRNAISLGGDADTMACIAGAIAEAYYGGVPPAIERAVLDTLDEPLRRTVLMFGQRYQAAGDRGAER